MIYVTFKLKNNGDKELSKVTVTVYFKDKDGKVIAEKSFNPINEYNLFEEDRLLKPNHIWQVVYVSEEKDYVIFYHNPGWICNWYWLTSIDNLKKELLPRKSRKEIRNN